MKRLLMVASVMMATGAMVLAQGNVAQALMDLERQWSKAAVAGNARGIDPLLAADFLSFPSDGAAPQTKAVFLASKSKWQVYEVSEMKVQVHGDSAVVSGIWTGKGTDEAGKSVSPKERFADTWVKMPDGKWQCVASASITLK